MNTALMPMPRLQFSDINGMPLAGGFVYTYAAGTTTPLATYQDSLGAAANANPIVLDSSGSASIWLSAAIYKIVLQDLNGVLQWTQDQVSAISLAELQGNATFSSLTIGGALSVTGAGSINGTLTAASSVITGTSAVQGAFTAASAATTGNQTVGGSLSAASLAVSGNETVGGTLAVTGATSLSTLSVGGTDIRSLITGLIPSLTALSGTLVISNVATSGNWVIFTFGATAGSRVRIAFGAGAGVATGGTIPLPSGFTSSQLIAHASVDAVSTTTRNQLSAFGVSVTGGTITVTASDSSGHNFVPTAAWSGVAWQTSY